MLERATSRDCILESIARCLSLYDSPQFPSDRPSSIRYYREDDPTGIGDIAEFGIDYGAFGRLDKGLEDVYGHLSRERGAAVLTN